MKTRSEKRSVGRPRYPKGTARTLSLYFRISEQELSRLEALAKKNGTSAGILARAFVMERIEKEAA